MNTKQPLMNIGGLEVLVLRKDIKNLHLNVLPPEGRVRVSAPNNMNEDAIRTFIASRISWIKKKQKGFKSQDRQTQREYISGESHYYLGKRFKLEVNVSEGMPGVTLKGKKIIQLNVKPAYTKDKREDIMHKYYRDKLRETLEPIIKEWTKKIQVKPAFWGIRKMKTRWGTCDTESKHIWFNLELAKKPQRCIEYIVVHELVHIRERKHDEKFVSLMDRFLPKWRSEKEELNQFALSYEKWSH